MVTDSVESLVKRSQPLLTVEDQVGRPGVSGQTGRTFDRTRLEQKLAPILYTQERAGG